jgi:hypothetical protein
MKIEPVDDALNASLFLIAGAERPLVPYISVRYSGTVYFHEQPSREGTLELFRPICKLPTQRIDLYARISYK